ncbi:alcohol dehydrogenase catalytic domain-containing protein [Streptomyces prunicolor]|uniref:alcohol dehydrogenase catalytic domain-containing protein n=1 Tax=Streptomyces prunicolor TaxID=67348 RepID=UPI0038688AED
MRGGRFASEPLAHPAGLGMELSGVVDAVGDGVDVWRVGQAVFGRSENRDGTRSAPRESSVRPWQLPRSTGCPRAARPSGGSSGTAGRAARAPRPSRRCSSSRRTPSTPAAGTRRGNCPTRGWSCAVPMATTSSPGPVGSPVPCWRRRAVTSRRPRTPPATWTPGPRPAASGSSTRTRPTCVRSRRWDAASSTPPSATPRR